MGCQHSKPDRLQKQNQNTTHYTGSSENNNVDTIINNDDTILPLYTPPHKEKGHPCTNDIRNNRMNPTIPNEKEIEANRKIQNYANRVAFLEFLKMACGSGVKF